jgi:hypothetical protein
LFELGIFDYLLERYPNLNRNKKDIFNLLGEFCSINGDTISRTFTAIDKPRDKNNPYNNPLNEEYIQYTFEKYKLNRHKKGDKK